MCCSFCNGRLRFYDGGAAADYALELMVCEDCGEVASDWVYCSVCDGTSVLDGLECPACNGIGKVEV